MFKTRQQFVQNRGKSVIYIDNFYNHQSCLFIGSCYFMRLQITELCVEILTNITRRQMTRYLILHVVSNYRAEC